MQSEIQALVRKTGDRTDGCSNASGLCQCGCDQLTTRSPVTDRRKGYVRGCPRLYINGHGGANSKLLYIEDEHGCWIWQRTRNEAGYGRIRQGGKMRFTHAVWYEREIGLVPKGMMLHHTCLRGHLGCMNPRHLAPVTAAENARLSRAAKLNLIQVAFIRVMFATGEWTKTALARRFNVSDVQIHYIVTEQCWSGI
jgi:hypothetical protein